MIKQILWDWNGTLLDDLAYGIRVRNRTFPAFGLPTMDSIEEYHRQFTFPIRTYYERAGVTDENFVAVAHAWMDEYVRSFAEVSLHEDACETLERFRQAGMKQVVLSASRRDMLCDQIASFGIQSCFSEILGLDNIYAGSKEEIGRRYLESCGVHPRETIMLGDTLHDADVAKAVGVGCILIARGHQSRQTLLESGFPVVSTLREAAVLVMEK